MKEYIIDGAKFRTTNSFFRHTTSLFTSESSRKFGRNADVFAELLEGGFGQHAQSEQIRVVWQNMSMSREWLPPESFNALLKILTEAENVQFEQKERK